MKMIHYYFLIVLFALTSVIGIAGQDKDWMDLTPLESSREDVENILGEPLSYFDTYGLYKTDFGKFSVWYSTGDCRKGVEGRQYNVPAKKMTGLSVILYKPVPIEEYICKQDYKREKSDDGFGRYLYKSSDESKIYEVFPLDNDSEMVLSISLEPSKDKRDSLCKETIKNIQ